MFCPKVLLKQQVYIKWHRLGIEELRIRWSSRVDLLKYRPSLEYENLRIYGIISTLVWRSSYWKLYLRDINISYYLTQTQEQAVQSFLASTFQCWFTRRAWMMNKYPNAVKSNWWHFIQLVISIHVSTENKVSNASGLLKRAKRAKSWKRSSNIPIDKCIVDLRFGVFGHVGENLVVSNSYHLTHSSW